MPHAHSLEKIDVNEFPQNIHQELADLRAQLDGAFSPDTAYPGTILDHSSTLSAGHCAVVAAIVNSLLGGTILSTCVEHEEHWFNRICFEGTVSDVDLTGDQFGREPIQIAPAGMLYPVGENYPEAVERTVADLEDEARGRAARLARRAGLLRLADAFEQAIAGARPNSG